MRRFDGRVVVVAIILGACTSTSGERSAPPLPSDVTTRPPASTSDVTSTMVEIASTATTTTIPATTTTAPAATSTPYVVPVADVAGAGWSDTHASYPATDIFNNGCGGTVVSPVNGTLIEVRRVTTYDPAVDNPATRGGRSISILGDDGVRYYLAHFESIDEALEPGVRVAAGRSLGTIGTTGRSSACHVHFGISPPCPEKEWSIRRGVVWPSRYLDDWRNGGQTSPADEVARFRSEHPNACAEAAEDPFRIGRMSAARMPRWPP